MIVIIKSVSQFPQFGRIIYIFILECNEIFFLVKVQETKDFLHHYRAYEIVDTDRFSLINRRHLASYICVNSHLSNTGAVCVPLM